MWRVTAARDRKMLGIDAFALSFFRGGGQKRDICKTDYLVGKDAKSLGANNSTSSTDRSPPRGSEDACKRAIGVVDTKVNPFPHPTWHPSLVVAAHCSDQNTIVDIDSMLQLTPYPIRIQVGMDQPS